MYIVQTRERPGTIQLRLCGNSQWVIDGAMNRQLSTLPEGVNPVLEQGVAELKLPHDVLAVVEAPASMVLLDERTLQLNHGRAFFRVEPEGKGFAVVTPHQRLVDLGTEFGVDSRQGQDEVELHVFKGRVRVDALEGEGKGEIIEAARAVLLKGAQVEKDLEGPRTAFLRELPPKVEVLFQDDFESGLVAGREYAVRMDRTVIRDFSRNRFEGIQDDTTWTFTTAPPVAPGGAFHDLGGEASPGNITTQRNLETPIDLISFADGTDTGVDLSIAGAVGLDLRAAGETKAPAAGTPAAELFLASGIDLDDGFVYDQERSSPGPTTFTFTGLNPDLRFDVTLYGDRSGTHADGKERFTLKGVEGATNRSSTGIVGTYVTEMSTRPNFEAGHVVRWAGIDPGADGVITIEIDPSENGDSNIAYLSALRLAASDADGARVSFQGAPLDATVHADGDGMPDAFELAHGGSATSLRPDDDLENDGAGDGLTNLREFRYGTDPNNPDTDGDGTEDGAEVAAGTNPVDPASKPLRVMSIGESIFYRAGLSKRLSEAGYKLLFVGEASETSASGIRKHQPDMVLLQVGREKGGSGSPAELDALVDAIFGAKPDLHLLIGLVPPGQPFDQDLSDDNRHIREVLVPAKAADGLSISTVDLQASKRSSDQIAESWFEGIEALDLNPSDNSPPGVVFVSPANDATTATPGGNLTMTFDEPIKTGTGRIMLRNLAENTVVEIPVGSPRLSVSGAVLTIDPPADLEDGVRHMGRIGGWESGIWSGIFNPGGTGEWYRQNDLKDEGRGRGIMGSMQGPVVATIGDAPPGSRIRRELGAIASDARYTISVAIGVRAEDAEKEESFDGYTIRLASGGIVLASVSGDAPPGPANSVSSVGFSWSSGDLSEVVKPGDPIALEIAPNQASGEKPGYLDFDNVRVSVLERVRGR